MHCQCSLINVKDKYRTTNIEPQEAGGGVDEGLDEVDGAQCCINLAQRIGGTVTGGGLYWGDLPGGYVWLEVFGLVFSM